MDIESSGYRHPLVTKFGRWLVSRVRDRTIEVFDAALDHTIRDPILPQSSLRIIETLSAQQKEMLTNVLADVVTYTIGVFVSELEQSRDIDVIVRDGNTVGNMRELSYSLLSEMYGEDGWVAAYSTKRVSQYYASDDVVY